MSRPPCRRIFLAAVMTGALLLPLAGGCAFDRKWKRFGEQPADVAQVNDLSGRWTGTWTSERTNHSGKLRAIITPVDEVTYRADFDATYMGILRFGYSMNLAAQPGDGASVGGTGAAHGSAGAIRFTGQEDLGWLAGGLYRYEGTADGRSFDCAYQSKNDHGRFRMTRPAAK